MSGSIKFIAGCATIVLILLLALCVFYPSKSSQVITSVEATGSVAVDKLISAMEDRMGKTDVALEHYNTALKAKRRALVELKGLLRDTERKNVTIDQEITKLRSAGNEVGAKIKEQEKAVYVRQLASMKERAEKAEKSYTDFKVLVESKKLELASLKAQAQALRSELNVMGGGM